MRKQQKPKISVLDEKQSKVREYFKDPLSPNLYISYQDFFKNFPINDGNFTNENLNLIDIHLRYRWFVRQKMASYKWIPIICMTPLLFHNYWLILAIPYFTVKMFDHYFESFFIWRCKKQPIINIRNEFITKLSKDQNKMRRIALFQSLKDKLQGRKQQNGENAKQGPLKYIKFGEYTQYIFHAYMDGKEQSSVLQTTIFETFLDLKYFLTGLNQFRILKDIAVKFNDDFWKFKKDQQRTKYKINLAALLDRDTIKQTQVYTLEDNIDHNIRRYSQICKYLLNGRLEPSEFKLWQYLNLSNYQDIFEKTKYNIKQNNSDLLVYYSLLAIPKLFKIIFKRR